MPRIVVSIPFGHVFLLKVEDFFFSDATNEAHMRSITDVFPAGFQRSHTDRFFPPVVNAGLAING